MVRSINIITAGLSLLLIFGLTGCDTGPAPSLFDPDPTSNPDPVIASVDPPASALAGVDVVTITGSNFSPVPTDNLVYFNDTRVDVLEASATELEVVPPPTPQDSVLLRVAVLGAANFSNGINYKLDPAAESISDIQEFEELFGIGTDAAGNIYASMFVNNISAGIKKIAPDGTRSDFVASSFKWDDIQFASDGALITVRNVRAIFRFEEGGAQETWAVVPDQAVRLIAIDFDTDGNLWAGGSRSDTAQPVSLYRIDPSLNIVEFPLANFPATIVVAAIAIGNGKLYAAIRDGDNNEVWSYDLTGGNLGAGERILAFTDEVSSTARLLSLAVTESGEIYVGSTAPDPIVAVHPDNTWDILFPGILEPSALSLAWGTGSTLYMVKGRTQIPGTTELTDSDLLKIETRQQGIR